MSQHELDLLLKRIADGELGDGVLSRARALLAVDERLPPELRAVLDDEPRVGAEALLGVLGLDDGLSSRLQAELTAEAGPIEPMPPMASWAELEAAMGAVDIGRSPVNPGPNEVTAPMVEELERQPLFLAQAVRREAGRVDVAPAVLAALGATVLPLADAVVAEAGSVQVDRAVLQAVGVALLPVAEAVRAEAGVVELAAKVMQQLGAHELVPLAQAVRSEAGQVNVADVVQSVVEPSFVSAMLDRELGPEAHRLAARRLMSEPEHGAQMTAFADLGQQLRSGLRADAGEVPYIWGAVSQAIGTTDEVQGWDESALPAALRAEAGDVDVADAVMRAVRQHSVAPELIEAPEPANSARWQTGAFALVAVCLLAIVGLSQIGANDAAMRGQLTSPTNLDFASSSEVVIEELEYADGAFVQIIQNENEETGESALIIWIDEGGA